MSLFFIIIYLILIILFGATLLVGLVTRIPYVPSKTHVVKKIIEIAKLKNGEFIYDLGCGDGRLLIEAAKNKKIKAIGFEIAPLMYLSAIIRKFFLRGPGEIEIRFKNMFKANLEKADIVFCYLMPYTLPTIAKKIKKECAKGTRIISNTFKIPNLKLEKHFPKDNKYPSIWLYRV